MSRRFEIQELLIKHQRRLQKLQEKEAVLGINTPPEILTEIEDIKANIEHLQEELKGLDQSDGSSIQQHGKMAITQSDKSKEYSIRGFEYRLNFPQPVWKDEPYTDSRTGILMEKDFYNREAEKAALKKVLSDPGHQPAIIVGERRSGKTSMLKLLEYYFRNHPSGDFLPVVVVTKGISSRNELIFDILTAISSELELDSSHLSRPHYTTPNEFAKKFHTMTDDFPHKRFIVCIDEIDSLLCDIPDAAERARIVGLMLNLVEIADLPLKFLVTTAYPLDWPKLASTHLALLNYKSLQVRLRPFSKNEFNEMIVGIVGTELILSSGDIQRLYTLSGGWPYYAKVLLHSLAVAKYDDSWFDRAISVATSHPTVSSALAHIYQQHFDDNEKAVVLLLATTGGFIETQKVATMSKQLRIAVHRLIERDYLTTHPDGSLSFRIGFLAEWFPRWYEFDEEVYQRLKRSL